MIQVSTLLERIITGQYNIRENDTGQYTFRENDTGDYTIIENYTGQYTIRGNDTGQYSIGEGYSQVSYQANVLS
jgi:hypothetical protein